MGTKKTVRQRLIFPQKPQKQVLGLYEWAPKLAGLISRKKNDSSGLFRVTFKHTA
jgi:hypothetical protein